MSRPVGPSICVDCGCPMHPADARQSLLCHDCLGRVPLHLRRGVRVSQEADAINPGVLTTPGQILAAVESLRIST